MDASPPFAADAERVRLLYRLPLSGQEGAILVVGSRDDARRLLDSEACAARVEVSDDVGLAAGAKFDAVILPLALLGHLEEDFGSVPKEPFATLLRSAYEALRPGGVLVGHLDHILSLATVRTALRGQVSWRSWRGWRGAWSGRSCLETLKFAGFEVAECFYVEPRVSAPMSLVPLAWLPARAHFVRAIRRTRSQYSTAGYLFRLVLAGLGFGGALQPHLYFWAKRPC